MGHPVCNPFLEGGVGKVWEEGVQFAHVVAAVPRYVVIHIWGARLWAVGGNINACAKGCCDGFIIIKMGYKLRARGVVRFAVRGFLSQRLVFSDCRTIRSLRELDYSQKDTGFKRFGYLKSFE